MELVYSSKIHSFTPDKEQFGALPDSNSYLRVTLKSWSRGNIEYIFKKKCLLWNRLPENAAEEGIKH